MNIKEAVEKLVPNALYRENLYIENNRLPDITKEDYEEVEWLDDRDKPTWEELVHSCFLLLKERKAREIDNYRDYRLSKNVPYTFPGEIEGHVQIRDEKDFRNIISNLSEAQIKISNEDTSKISFRDYENRIHELTPQEIVDMGLTVISNIRAVHEESWRHKNIIKDFEMDENNPEESYQELENYNIQEEWKEE